MVRPRNACLSRDASTIEITVVSETTPTVQMIVCHVICQKTLLESSAAKLLNPAQPAVPAMPTLFCRDRTTESANGTAKIATSMTAAGTR